jgi:hypothetical protein
MRNMLEKSPVKLIKFKNLSAIPDERRITRPRSAWLLFMQDRVNDSDFDGIAMIERTKLVASEWRALSESEKKVRFQVPSTLALHYVALRHYTT